MLYVQRRWRNGWSYSPSLHESAQLVAIGFCFVCCTVNDAFFSWGISLKMVWFFCWEKKKKRLTRLSCYGYFWTILRERNRRAFNNCESLDQTIKTSFLNLFGNWIKLYIGDGSLLVLEFMDWLGFL